MLTKLSPEQEALMYTVRDEWINLLDKPNPLNKEQAERGIYWLYKLAKLDRPKIIWCESPRSAVDSAVQSAVYSSVHSSVYSAVQSALYSAVGIYWLGFYAWADYYRRVGIVKAKDIDRILGFLRSGIYETYIFEGKAFAVPMPQAVHRDEKLRLHSRTHKSIKWSDGWGLYSLWGVTMDEALWRSITNKTITAKEILALKNIEQRMVAMKYIGLDNLISELRPKTINKSKRGNELIEITEGFPTTQYALRYKCSSTGREYLSFVPPEIGAQKNADLAMSWKFGIGVKEYDSLEIET